MREEDLFIELKNKLETLSKVWHGINNPARAKAYFKAIRGVPIDYWSGIFDGFLDNASKMPLPSDFRDAAAAYFRSNPKPKSLDDSSELCFDCYNTGFLFAKRSNQDTEQYLCICHCPKGEIQENHYKKNIEFIPRWDLHKTEFIFGFVKCPFPHELFVSKDKLIDNQKDSQFSQIVTRWKSKIKESNEYWNK